MLILAIGCFAAPHKSGAPTCGVPAIKPDTSTNIVGGKEAIPYSWPWQAFLIYNRSWPWPRTGCGATLISKQWILTAGHCVMGMLFGGPGKPSQFSIRLGVFEVMRTNETGEQVLGVSELHVHPKYGRFSHKYDVALLKLERPLEFTDHISPVCLPNALGEKLPEPDTATFVTGWGTTEPENASQPDSFLYAQGGLSPTLQQVSVPIVSTDKCKKAYDSSVDEKVMFCAGLDEGGKDSCSGDSGGPVVVQDLASNGKWTQIGIVSWGNGCAQPGFYGVYSKVSAFMDFIQQYVKDF